MAEGTVSSGPEGASPGSETARARQFTRAEVLANAALGDEERKQVAANLLDKTLTQQQQQELLDAHREASNELGKDKVNPAGVFNLTPDQMRRKLEKLPGFSLEERRKLVEAGLVGALPVTFNPDDYASDSELKGMADELLAIDKEELADAGVFTEYINRLNGLVDRGTVTDKPLAMKLRLDLVKFRHDTLHPPRPPEDPFLSERDIQRIQAIAEHEAQRGGRNEPSQFDRAKAEYLHYSKGVFNGVRVKELPPDLRVELLSRREESKKAIIELIDQLFAERDAADSKGENVFLRHLKDEALKFYKKVKSAKQNDMYGGNREEVIKRARHGNDFEEAIFEDSPELKELEAQYGGLLRYIYAGIVQEADKDVHNRDKKSELVPRAREMYEEIKERRARERKRETKYETRATQYGVIWELNAENARELPEAVLDFTRDKIFALVKQPPEDIDKEVRKIGEETERLLDQNRIRLIEEGIDIPETHPDFLRAKALVVAIPYVLGYEQLLLKGGEEATPAYKLKIAADFIDHDNAIYLENPKAALQMHLLTTYRDGIYWMGHRFDQEKPGDGEDEEDIPGEGSTKGIRGEIEEYVVEYASSHDLFLSDDMTKGLFDGKGAFEYREKGNPEGRDLRYAFDDNIEKLLLDLGNERRRQIAASGDGEALRREALRRHDLRVGVFRKIKESLDEREGLGFVSNQERKQMERQKGKGRRLTDKELLLRVELKKNTWRAEIQQWLKTQGISEGQISAFPEEIEVRILEEADVKRQQAIRQRIMQKMSDREKRSSYMKQLTIRAREKLGEVGLSDPERDKILWKWVADYNEYRIKLRLSRWHPSGWDRVRVEIDRPTKVLNRGLSGDELMAMYDPNSLQFKSPEELSDEDRKEIDFKENEARFGFKLARSYQVFHLQDTLLGGTRTRLTDPDTGKYIGKLPDNNDRNHPNWETNRRLGLTDENGRVVDPKRKIVRIFDVVQVRLQQAIEEEAAAIDAAKAEKAAAVASGNQQLIGEKTQALRNIMVNSQFAATHVLKELGLVEGKLPVWSFNFLDPTTMDVFTKALADYGFEVGEFVGAEKGPGLAIDHNDKKEFYELMERGRRALKSEWDRAAKEFMEGRFRITDDQGRPARALMKAASDWGTNIDPVIKDERNRIINIGAVRGNRKITEFRFQGSTSGALTTHELVSTVGDIGFYSMLVWLGVTDIRSLHGYVHRRNEKEFHDHQYFDVMDQVDHAKSQSAAFKAVKALAGGADMGGGKTSPGFFQDPFLASIRINETLRVWAQESKLTQSNVAMQNTLDYLNALEEWRNFGGGIPEDKKAELERLRQMTYLDFPNMRIPMNQELYLKMYEVLAHFIFYLNTLKDVQQNRAPGKATRSWYLDNMLKWYSFRSLMRKAHVDRKGFILRHAFSPEIASEVSLRMIQQALEGADYQIPLPYETSRLAYEGAVILAQALTPDEQKNGFGIPNEEDWINPEKVKPAVRKALETIRERGLLPFMQQEGYPLVNAEGEFIGKEGVKVSEAQKRKVLGYEVPPQVRDIIEEKNKGKYLDLLPEKDNKGDIIW